MCSPAASSPLPANTIRPCASCGRRGRRSQTKKLHLMRWTRDRNAHQSRPSIRRAIRWIILQLPPAACQSSSARAELDRWSRTGLRSSRRIVRPAGSRRSAAVSAGVILTRVADRCQPPRSGPAGLAVAKIAAIAVHAVSLQPRREAATGCCNSLLRCRNSLFEPAGFPARRHGKPAAGPVAGSLTLKRLDHSVCHRAGRD